MEPWEQKAHRLIAEMARAAFERANRLPNGQLRKKHVPYTLPNDAVRLVKYLGENDEVGAKALFHELAFRKAE